MDITEEKINQVIKELQKRASEDNDFRKLCLDNPNEAIRKVSDIEVPEDVKINIIQNDPGIDHTIILPPEPHTLSDEDMHRIAGGRDRTYRCFTKGDCTFRM